MDRMPEMPLEVMEPVRRRRPFDSPEHLFEPKLDGVRYVAFVAGSRVRLQNRSLRDKTHLYPEMAALAADLDASEAVLDGEMVVWEAGRQSFHGVLRRDLAAAARAGPKVWYGVFDLLFLNGADLRDLPLAERRARLRTALGPSDICGPVEGRVGCGRDLFREMEDAGWEGVVAKDLDSPYRGGRQPSWAKIKCRRQLWATIIGHSQAARAGGGGSLLVAVPAGEELVYAGRVGSGVSRADWVRLMEHLGEVHAAHSYAGGVPRPLARTARWVVPCLEVLVAYQEWTPSGVLRAPSIKGFRAARGVRR